jgi:hypothetical protein
MRKRKKSGGVYRLINNSAIADVNVGSVAQAFTVKSTEPPNVDSQQELQVHRFIKDNFDGDVAKVYKILEDYKSNDKIFNAMQAVRASTEKYNQVLDKLKQKVATTTDKGVRKQKFGKNRLAPLVPLIAGAKEINDVPDLNWALKLDKVSYQDDVGNTKPITGIGLYSYMERNKISHVVDIIKAWTKDKSLKVPSWGMLIIYLKTLNFKPDEVFNYAVSQINTKKRYLEHRLYRDIENGAHKQLKDFIDIYKSFKNSPLKSFYGSNELNEWSRKYNILFKSEENLRVNLKLMLSAWKKVNPEDKI